MSEIPDWSSKVTYHKGDRVRTMYGEATFDGEKFVLDVAGDTPRTDAAEKRIAGPNPWNTHDCGAVHASFARQLERDLSAMHAEFETGLKIIAEKDALISQLSQQLENQACIIRTSVKPADELQRVMLAELSELREDKKRLDWLNEQGTAGLRWIARDSTQGRGYRLHQDLRWAAHEVNHETPRAAIDAARKATPCPQ